MAHGRLVMSLWEFINGNLGICEHVAQPQEIQSVRLSPTLLMIYDRSHFFTWLELIPTICNEVVSPFFLGQQKARRPLQKRVKGKLKLSPSGQRRALGGQPSRNQTSRCGWLPDNAEKRAKVIVRMEDSSSSLRASVFWAQASRCRERGDRGVEEVSTEIGRQRSKMTH